MRKTEMEISKKGEKEGDKRIPVGKVTYFYPELSELGFSVEPKSYDEETQLPLYEDEKHQFLFDAVLAATRAIVRNKLVNGTITLRNGLSIPETVEALLERSEQTGEALKAFRDCKKDFVAWLPTSGKSEKFQAMAKALFAAPEALSVQSNKRKEQVGNIVQAFMLTLSKDNLSRYESYLKKVGEACQPDEEDDDDE